jgi:hypothetical protein
MSYDLFLNKYRNCYLKYNMTRDEMIEWLKNEVTMSGSINISIKDAEYERVLDKEIKMVYQLYPVSVKHQYTVIPRAAFYTADFRRNRTLQFPDCVLSVGKFEEMTRRNSLFGINDADFSFNKCFQADMWLGSQMNMDSVMFRTIQWSLWDQLKTFTLIDIRHSWNEADKTLLVLGHDPRSDVFCELYTKAAPTELYDDPWVRQYIGAKCKLQVVKTIGTFTTNMIGGVTVNTSMYSEEANKDIEECKEQWKMQTNADIFFLTTP